MEDLNGELVKVLLDSYLMPAVLTVVGSIVSVLLFKLKTFLNVKISAENENILRNVATDVVAQIAERSASGEIEKDDNKSHLAVKELVRLAPVSVTPVKANAFIKAAVFRALGEGASGKIK